MMNVAEKLYEKFTISERINLTIAALSRGDEEEVAILKRTCPKKTYTMLDREYVSKIDALSWVAMQFKEIYDFYLNKITLCQTGIKFFMFMSDHHYLDNKYLDKNIKRLRKVFIRHNSHLKSLTCAITQFCEEVGIDVKHLMRLLEINSDNQPLIDECDLSGIERDDDFRDYAKDLFLSMWTKCSTG